MDSYNINDTNSNNNNINPETKKIDNRILTVKEKINSIDEKIDESKKKIKELSDMQDNVTSIAKSMNKCIDLLSKALYGPKINNRFNEMRSSNKAFLIKSTTSIEEETMIERKRINELYKEKDMIIKENRNSYNKKEQELKEHEAMIQAKKKLFNNEKNTFIENIEKKSKRK